jgi:hypothetical protein
MAPVLRQVESRNTNNCDIQARKTQTRAPNSDEPTSNNPMMTGTSMAVSSRSVGTRHENRVKMAPKMRLEDLHFTKVPKKNLQ